jgi:hypothetical protein
MMCVHIVRRGVWLAIAVVMAACSASDSHTTKRADSQSPRAEFLLAAADSTFWVATASGATKIRGAPMILAKYDGRFYEVYADHQDLSYPDAQFLGDRIYRRDLVTGDSTVVMIDTLVPRMAREYAAAHPDERPLGPNHDDDTDPETAVTAEFDILDVFGPYLSYEYHVDVEVPDKTLWHATRQGVLDLRTAKAPRVSDLIGRDRAARLTQDARRAYSVMVDSIVRVEPTLKGEDRQTAEALARLTFDESSFTLNSVDGQLAVTFSVPGHGEGVAGEIVELDPQPVDSVAWWPAVASGQPLSDDEGNDRWSGSGSRYQIIARYDTSRTLARLSLADGGEREWPIATVQAPLFQVLWLDNPPVPDADRKALLRAFSHAASYDQHARIAAGPAKSRYFQFVTTHASSKNRPRKPARNVRAHDATTCQQPGACLRRSDLVDDGQDRGHRRLSSQPRERRDRLDRSRRVSRADSRRRSRGDEVQCQLRGANVDGSGRPRRSGRSDDGSAQTHKLVLSDLRCRRP